MNLFGQATINLTYASDAESGHTTVTFTAPGDVSLGVIVLETSRLKSFFGTLATVFAERSVAEGLPPSADEQNKLMLRTHQQVAEIGFSS